MATTIKGPGVFLAQFAGDRAPFNSLPTIIGWAADLGYKGVQIPSWDGRLFDLEKAATSRDYCDEIKGICGEAGVELTDLSTHMQGQLVAVHPAYDHSFNAIAPSQVRGDPRARLEWAMRQMRLAAKASSNLGLDTIISYTGSLAFPYVFPWPPRPGNVIDEAFTELARRWRPLLDTFDEHGVDVCFELNPGEDVFDGATFEMFLDKLSGHERCNINYDPSHFLLQQLDYLKFIDLYHERIKAFHVKDAEFNPDGRQGMFSGYQRWADRAARFRSTGDGQVDFRAIFSKLTQYDYGSWAVLEWECALKSPEVGAREGAKFIRDHIIEVTAANFDDAMTGDLDKATIGKIFGLEPNS